MSDQDLQNPQANTTTPVAQATPASDPFGDMTVEKVEHIIYGSVIFFMCFMPFVFGGTLGMICLLIAMLMGGAHLLAAFTGTNIVRSIAKMFVKE